MYTKFITHSRLVVSALIWPLITFASELRFWTFKSSSWFVIADHERQFLSRPNGQKKCLVVECPHFTVGMWPNTHPTTIAYTVGLAYACPCWRTHCGCTQCTKHAKEQVSMSLTSGTTQQWWSLPYKVNLRWLLFINLYGDSDEKCSTKVICVPGRQGRQAGSILGDRTDRELGHT